jgi:hypothetical protein
MVGHAHPTFFTIMVLNQSIVELGIQPGQAPAGCGRHHGRGGGQDNPKDDRITVE